MKVFDRADQERFEFHSKKWKDDTICESSTTAISMHPSYQAIVGMGSAALPFIFKDLEQELSYWFWALHAITQVDPVPKGHEGDIEKMGHYWLDWGRENGYL